nr:MAG TPA: hypothetical protein [Caudoviricetes sp.]
MATIMNDAAYMGFPLSIKRGNPAPVDTTAVWYDKTELETYAASGATAYVGQVLTLVAGGKCEAYMISNEAGTLVKLASTTASGDLASDVATLQGQVADLIKAVGAKAQGETAATGLYKEIADVLAVANGKVGSVAAADKSVTIGGSATAPTVKVAIASGDDNALTLASDGLKVVVPEVTHPEYTIVEDKASTDYSAVYHLQKNGKNVGAAINIPKDMVVKSGSVETKTASGAWGEPGTYLHLVLANATEDDIYINVGDLIEYVTTGTSPDGMVIVSISDDHQVTATLGDASITEAKLAKAVTDKLAKAVSAVQKVEAGTENGSILVDDVKVSIPGLKSAAYTESSAYDAAGTAAGIKTALEGTSASDSSTATIAGAKKYAEEKASAAQTAAEATAKGYVDALDVTDTAVAKKLVSAVEQTDGKIKVTRRELVADDIPELGISKISGLQAAIDAKQDELTFNTAYDASTNKAATMSDIGTAKNALVGTADDASTVDTIKGAKKYADEKAKSALDSAKEYADGLVTGDDGIAALVNALEGKVDVAKVSTAISAAKTEAISAAATDASTKDTALKTAILGEADYAQTVKSAYELANSKTTMAAVEAKDYATKTEAQGYADAKNAAIAEAKKAGTDAAAKIGTIPDGSKATTAIGYVDEQVKKVKDAEVDYTVTVTPSTVEGIAKRYIIAQQSTGLNVNIDIPSDMVVKSGKVVENPATQSPGTYLELTLANATNDKVYIDVGSLIEYVVGGAAADGIITTAVTIDAQGDHVLTATIGDGKITKAKLVKAVQDSLDKADSALQAADLADYAKTADIAAGYVAKNGTDRLMTKAEGDKLGGIASGAQANVIESVKVGGTALTVTDKAVDITSISTDLLDQGTQTLVLKGGNAATLAQG